MLDFIKVQQALFGYREGHNLLASSIPLSPHARHFLATSTDSPGSESSEGFEHGFTGIPVPETDYYALFQTWPAPEMPRPGCVWSHVLLVELSTIARIEDLSLLRKLFRRPDFALQTSFSSYIDELELDQAKLVENKQAAIDRTRARALLDALYGNPAHGIVVLDQTSQPWEEIVFAIWSQQWPRLRRNFSFSTSSLGDRRLAGVKFDLQIAPIRSERLWRRDEFPTQVLNMEIQANKSALPPLEPWMNFILADLECGEGSQLRNFLFSYGSDVEPPREAFFRLVKSYAILNKTLDWGERLGAISDLFPGEHEALRLKEMLVSPDSATESEREWSTAVFLLTSERAKAFAKVSFDHVRLVPDLWQKKRGEVLEIVAQLVRKDENPTSTAFVNAIGKCITPDDLRNIASRYPELIPVFIRQRPELAYDTGTWELPGYVQSQIFEVLEELSLKEDVWAKIMGAMFVAATYVSVDRAVKHSGSFAIQGAYRWLQLPISSTLLPSSAWRYALMDVATNELKNGKTLLPAELALCSWIARPDTVRRALSITRPDVLELADTPLEALPKPLRSYTAFLLVTVGLSCRNIKGVKLIKRGYFLVHEILAGNKASDDEWSLINPELPRIGWGEWDRCEKLRRATRKWLKKYAGNSNLLLAAAATSQEGEIAQEIFAPSIQQKDDDEFID